MVVLNAVGKVFAATLLLGCLTGCPGFLMPGDPWYGWSPIAESQGAQPFTSIVLRGEELTGFVQDRNGDGVWDFYLRWHGEEGWCELDTDFDGMYDAWLRLDEFGAVTKAGGLPESQRRAAGGPAVDQPGPYRDRGQF